MIYSNVKEQVECIYFMMLYRMRRKDYINLLFIIFWEDSNRIFDGHFITVVLHKHYAPRLIYWQAVNFLCSHET